MTSPHTSYDRGGDFGAFYEGNQRVKGIEPSSREWLVLVVVFDCFTLYLVVIGCGVPYILEIENFLGHPFRRDLAIFLLDLNPYRFTAQSRAATPFERFKRLTKKVVSVPHAEIQKRELEWKNGRKQHESHHRHR